VHELLDWLVEREDVKLRLLTGNCEEIPRLKLTRAGIGGALWLAPGAFAAYAVARDAVELRLALRTARSGRRPLASGVSRPEG
jgi:hypothetical protein